MDRVAQCNEELEDELSRRAKIPGLVAGVRAAVGVEADEELSELSEEYPVLGFHLSYNAELGITSVYLCTPGRFVFFECAEDGSQFTVAMPLARVRRVEERVLTEQVVLRIEVEADNLPHRLVMESAHAADPENPARQVGLVEGSLTALPAGYTLQASDLAAREGLRRFARVLRGALGE